MRACVGLLCFHLWLQFWLRKSGIRQWPSERKTNAISVEGIGGWADSKLYNKAAVAKPIRGLICFYKRREPLIRELSVQIVSTEEFAFPLSIAPSKQCETLSLCLEGENF